MTTMQASWGSIDAPDNKDGTAGLPRGSQSIRSEELSVVSGAATVVDAEEHIEKSKRQSVDSLDVPKSRDTRLTDLARIIERSTRFSHVTTEQIQRVRMMHDRLSDGAKFSFNYNILLLVASILAGLGLASNSSTIIIASMLVSPIMGPVVGMAYGSTICDWKLVRRSLRTETISLAFCIAVGAVVAAICGATRLAEDWPTEEMTSRGTWENFLVGLPVAFFSGLGVAVSLLDDQTSSLVGVAISASLLPPAVNAGVIWVAFAFVEGDLLWTDLTDPVPVDDTSSPTSLALEDLRDDESDKFMEMGLISLCLTFANIALIWIASMLMFRIKEVLPIEKKVFWNDLGVARKIYQKRALISQVIAASDSSDLGDDMVVDNDSSTRFVHAYAHDGAGEENSINV